MEHLDWTIVKQVVTEEINRWDPYGFIGQMGTPVDEFEPEIEELIPALRRVKREDEFAYTMYSVFTNMMGLTFRYSECLEVSKRIWERLGWGTM